MQGDFSVLGFDPREHERGVSPPALGVLRNVNAVLHQQGRVMTDADLTEGELLELAWNSQAGRDVIGAGICAVPATAPESFRIVAARVVGDEVRVEVHPGHAWADGLLSRLAGAAAAPDAAVERRAHYYGPPLSDPLPQAEGIGDGIRDAVILEVSEEALHGYQYPARLIEPALGGPDTAERAYVNMRFRLWRLGAGEDCASILGRLKDDPAGKGRLSVSLAPVTTIAGDCPVVGGGGYLGFEHHLYRIEIADGEAGAPARFKWSQWNGGLVGRGRFDATVNPPRVILDAGRTAIVSSGLTTFYLEALQYDALDGTWNVVCGSAATLTTEHDLELAMPLTFGTLPATTDPMVLRLWNGLRDIADFTDAANPVELRDGIRLAFDAPAGAHYRARDYWTFSVRAGDIPNPAVLIDQAPPVGIVYRRVPLAEINWTGRRDTTISGSIEDCRTPFRPLTQLETCCTYRVGDGIRSFGDFTSIQAAIDALPAAGGQVCVLPGTYTESITVTNRRNITLSGCGPRSLLMAGPPEEELSDAPPVIHVRGGQAITIADLAIAAHERGPGLVLEGADPSFAQDQDVLTPLIGVMLRGLHVSASSHSGLRALNAHQLTLRDSRIRMRDSSCLDTAVFVLGDDLLIERNVVEVPSSRLESPSFRALPAGADFLPGSLSRGGIQIGGTSERVRIVNNLIRGGAGNGITLGSLIFIDERNDPVPPRRWPRPRPFDPCDPKLPASSVLVITAFPTDLGQVRQASAGTLSEVVIKRNRIQQMGMNGIGVAGFFDLRGADEFISVEHLSILGNEIRGCLRRPLEPIPEAMVDSLGYGGIALADVEHLLIRDNVITDNGPSHLEPVCGIFALHAEGLEISRNRILDNGSKVEAGNAEAKIGRRGGIQIVYALAPVSPVRIGRLQLPAQNGEPALKVHDNVVSAPLGQALSVTALGPLSVVGNQFTSRGVVQRGPAATFLAATVAILNLGLSTEFYLQFLAYAAIAKGGLAVDTLTAAPAARPGLDDQRLGAFLAGGNVLFTGNQCLLDVIEAGISLSVSSVTIFSLDDIGFADNQCDCNLLDDLVLSHVVLFGFSLRACGNRLKESLLHARFSAITLGLANTTVHNQTTHCLLARAYIPAYRVASPNTVLIDPLGTGYCESASRILPGFGKTSGVTTNG
ncbi:MAG: hypothetical protein ER33_05030 [Cyanobium sp. CACIAM 14]|nr:MAG: hypothetical protein ER33_05030 [Cyanobium sp. CACIAM 14]